MFQPQPQASAQAGQFVHPDADMHAAIKLGCETWAHERAADEFKSEFVTLPALKDALGEACRRAIPNAELRETYKAQFNAFCKFCRAEHDVDGFTASGPLVAQWVLELAAVRRRPLAEVEEAVAAIRHYQALYRGEVYTEAALLFARAMNGGDDDGGLELDGGEEVPAENIEALPLAAEPQH